MKDIRLAFELRPSAFSILLGRTGRRRRVVAAAALLLGVGMLAKVAFDAYGSATSIASLEAELARTQPAPMKQSPLRSRTDAQAARSLDQITRQLNTPWSQLLDTLESSLPEDVALVSIEPDAGGKVRLQAEAKKLESLISYASSLRRLAVFASVALVKHETNEQDSNRPVRLAIELQLAQAQGVEGTRK